MQANIKIIVLLVIMSTSCLIVPRISTAQPSDLSYQLFYDQLSPYGQWVDYSVYGYVWIPDAGNDFEPYASNGRWMLTNYGWTWASNYDWGWAPFHYGRWSFNDSFGWFWVPDNEWGPAWVNWRQAEGYYGWSPMEPGITVSMSFGNVYNNRNDHWMFVHNNDIERNNINRYSVANNEHEQIVRNSTVIKNSFNDNGRRTVYVSGPTGNDVQNATGRRIVPVTIRDNNRPGIDLRNGNLQIYRPQIEKNTKGRKTMPARVSNMRDVKPKTTNEAPIQRQTDNPGMNTNRRPATVSPPINNSQPIQQRNAEPGNTNQINRPLQQTQPTQPAQQREVITPNREQPVQRNVEPITPERNSRSEQPVQQREVKKTENVQPVQERTTTQPVRKAAEQPQKPINQQLKEKQKKSSISGDNTNRK